MPSSAPLDLHVVEAHDLLHPSLPPVKSGAAAAAASAAHAAACDALSRGLSEHGFVHLHFDPAAAPRFRELVPPAFERAAAFFAAGAAEKATALPAAALPPGVTRGYLPTAAESGGEALELKEVFSWSDAAVVHAAGAARPFEHANVWPTATGMAPPLRPCLERLYDFFHATTVGVARALAPSLPSVGDGAPALDALVRAGKPTSLARALSYHPVGGDDAGDNNGPRPAPAGAVGSVEHTDWGMCTLIAQRAGSVGLEVHHGGAWRAVRGRPDCLLFLAGDFLALASSGRFVSARHRVVLTPNPRLSLAYFQYPPADAPFPSVGAVPRRVLDSLSLFTDQRRGAGGKKLSHLRTDGTPMSFGEFLMIKWDNVSRA